MPRLFVAVWPPDEVLDRVATVDRPALAGLRWTTRDQWHVTLRFLGEAHVDPVLAALAGVSARTVEVGLGPTVGGFDQRVLHVPVSGLDPLAADVVRATAHLGRPPGARPFAGHLTLARVATRARVDLRPLIGTPLSARWTVAGICLVESRLVGSRLVGSRLSSSGARYQIVDRVLLQPNR